MSFTSLSFAMFLALTFVLYWSLRWAGPRAQNLLLLAASYLFYGMWDFRFVLVLFFSTALDFAVGVRLASERKTATRRFLLCVSLLSNLSLLGFFKYFNFFLESLSDLSGAFGGSLNTRTLSILLPVGISYYTFKKLSYTIDVYRDTLKPTRDAIAFFSFVAFFPQLLAGPIDRGSTLLPQFLRKRRFSSTQASDGLRQILSGIMKKMLIADNLLPLVEGIFGNYRSYDGLGLSIGVFFASMQLYCDFSGYSDIAIGLGKLLGFRLMRNFATPYFSRDIAEFWRRWHISLSTWLRDYLYVPMCGNRPSRSKKAVFILLTFTLCGLWHEAAWTYVFWGFLHGVFFLPMTLRKMHPRYLGIPAANRFLPTFRESCGIAVTFLTTSFAWIFFLADSIGQALGMIAWGVSHPFLGLGYSGFFPMVLACVLLLLVEWVQREKEHFLEVEGLPLPVRWAIYNLCIIILLVFGAFGTNEFIYTQF